MSEVNAGSNQVTDNAGGSRSITDGMVTEGTVTEGTVLDHRYRLGELLGRGGTAEVYRGTDELLGRSVAVKVFDVRLTDLNTVVRQRNEMQVLARLTHPHLIAVYDAHVADPAGPAAAGTGSERTYLVLELVEGHTLADRISQGPLPLEQVGRLAITLASVLDTVHRQGMVHRDVKPANVLLSASGQIKLGDFGLARILTAEDRLTTGAEVMGTAAYFSPEQARAGDVGPPADIYSLGLVLLECLTGRKEFPGHAVAAAVARLLRDPVIPADLPAPWKSLLTAMTSGDPAVRPTASQVRAALVGDGTPTGPDATARASAARRDGEEATGPTTAWSSPVTPFLTRPPDDLRPSGRRHRRAIIASVLTIAALAAALWTVLPADNDAPNAHPTTTAHPTIGTGLATSARTAPPRTASSGAATPKHVSARSISPSIGPSSTGVLEARPTTPARVVAVTTSRTAPPSPSRTRGSSGAVRLPLAPSSSTASTPTGNQGNGAQGNGNGNGNGGPGNGHGHKKPKK